MKKSVLFLMAMLMISLVSCCNGNKKGACNQACGDSCQKVCADSAAVKPAKKTIVCRVEVKEGQQAAFIALAKTLTDSTRVEPGNVSYNLYQSPSDSKMFIFYEEYKDDAAFQVHANSAHFKAFADAIKPLLAKELAIEQY